jgi:polar amino acid transport system permease protein
VAGFAGTVNRVRDRVEARSARVPYRAKLGMVWIAIMGLLAWAFLAFGFDVEFMREWAPFVLGGIGYTLVVCVGGIVLAIPLALLGALGRLSKNPVANGVASFYVSFIRGTPLIVQVFFIYTGLPQFARFAPGWMAQYFILSAVLSGILALGINYGAYMTEIFRAGIQSVGHGQIEAAHALAMTNAQTTRRIVLPQAVRVIIPPTGNEFIAMLKDSALVGLVGTSEIFFRATKIGRSAFRNLEMLVIAAAVYWILTTIFSFFQTRLERRVSKGYVREQPHGH